MKKENYSYLDIANCLAIPLGTLYRLRKEGKGPRTQVIGKHFRVSHEDLVAWQESLK